MIDLARRLLSDARSNRHASGGATCSPTNPVASKDLVVADVDHPSRAAMYVVTVLRSTLTRFAGVDAFTALLRRALFLSAIRHPVLKTQNLTDEGYLQCTSEMTEDAATELIARLLELLTVFIGESLTQILVRDAFGDEVC